MALFAEVDQSNKVLRVVVCDTVEYLEQRLGGTWVETTTESVQEYYAGIGMGYDPESIALFAPDWVQPIPGIFDGYSLDSYSFHNGLVWQSLIDANVWEPGVFGWRDKTGQIPKWVQPLGAQDAFSINDEVIHNDSVWRSVVNVNVWEPGAQGITQWVLVPPPSPPKTWQDSGATYVSLVGAGVIRVSNTAPFSPGLLIRISGLETTVNTIFTPGANGILTVSPHINPTPGAIIEVFQ
jgi:hypothetical protein